MKEKKMTVREMIEARFNNCTRMNEIADAAEAREGKELTDAEKSEVQKLERENRIYDLQIAGSGVAPVASPVSQVSRIGYVSVPKNMICRDAR